MPDDDCDMIKYLSKSLDVTSFSLPPSNYLSVGAPLVLKEEEERQRRLHSSPTCPSLLEDTAAYRRHIDQCYFSELIACWRERFQVSIEPLSIANVEAEVIEAADHFSGEHSDSILINLHGGYFMFGGRLGGQVESIPVACLADIKVSSVDYRMAPKHRHPAAVDDVIAVYKALLNDYSPEKICIYGSSAGAILAGEVIGRALQEGLPIPAAVGMIAAAPLPFAGDANYFSAAINGCAPTQHSDLRYFENVAADDPEAFPGLDPEVLKRFPPSILISSSRDLMMGQVVSMHNRLIHQGAESNLHIWDGVGHCFTNIPGLLEAEQALTTMAKFFRARLSLHGIRRSNS